LLESQLGLFHGVYSPKRGDVVEVDDDDAERYIAFGRATRDLKTPTEELPPPYREDPDLVAKVVQRQAKSISPESRPLDVPAIGRRPMRAN
jgi:hypothetical protein